MFWDYKYYLFVMLPGLLLGLWAQWRLHSAFGKYSQIPVESGLTGAQAARRILDNAGLTDVSVEEVEGKLTDHYDPTKRALFLSSENYSGNSIAAVGVAAHETGHALQHQAAYALLNLRMALVPVTQFSSSAFGIILFLGWLMHEMKFALPIVIVLFSIITLFQLITLPVEYDASARAKAQLFRLGLVREDERASVAKVLNAAALTYVAALVSSLLTLLYYISASRRN
ncbi:MAG TPA: zinc metallopeptidase [Verrucomicrobiae bacterium]